MEDKQKRFLGKEFLALWKDYGALPPELASARPEYLLPFLETQECEQPAPLDLETVRRNLGSGCGCTLCPGRKNLVFGAGSPNAKLVFVGEAPGADEDNEGLPFVGTHGQLLTKIIEAMGFTREQVYLTNLVKCRPPQNRLPDAGEIAACGVTLRGQLQAIAPKMIVALGPKVCHALTGQLGSFSSLRGQLSALEWDPSTPVMPTYHPSHLIRNPEMKKLVWEDMKAVMAYLENAP